MSFLIATFYAWRRFILVCGLAGLLVVGAVAFLLPRWYRSTTTLLPPEPSAVLSVSEEIVRQLAAPLLGRVETGASPAAVCIEVLRSRKVGESLIREFGLMDSYHTGTMDECLDALRSHSDFAATENGAVAISFEDRSPVRAAMIANRATALLDSTMRDLKLSRAARTRDFVEQRMVERQEMLAQAENQLRDFQESSHAIVFDEQLAAAMEMVTALTARAISLEIEMEIAATYSSRSSQEYQRLKVEYDGVVGQLARLKTGVDGDDGGGSVSGTPVLADVPAIALEYGRLRRDVEVQARVYRMLVAAFEKSSLEAARNTPVVQVLDPAVPPTEHARPRRAILILAGAGLNLVWILGLVLAVSAWRLESPAVVAARNLLAPVGLGFVWLRRLGGGVLERVCGSRARVVVLLAISLLPMLAWVALRLTGYDSLTVLAVFGLSGATGALFLLLYPRWGVYSLVFWVFSGIGMYVPVDAAGPILILVLLATMLGLMRGGEDRLSNALFWVSTGLFVLFSLQSALVAKNPALTFRDLFTLGKVLAVVVVIVQVIRTPSQLRWLGYTAFAGAVATVAIGFLAIQKGLTGLSYIGGVDVLRFSGAHGNPNTAASIMCSALPFGFFAVHAERGIRRLLAVVGVVILIVAIFATFSRGILFSFAVLVVAFVIREVRSRRSFLVLSALIAVGLLLTPSFYWNRALGLTQAFKHASADWSVYTRLLAFKTGVEMFVQHPLTGIGLGNFIESASYRLFVRIVTHNTYLDIAVGAGIFGLAAFVTMLAAGFRDAWRGARAHWPRDLEWMNSFSFYSFLSLLSTATSGLLTTFSFRHQLWIPVAVGLVIGRLWDDARSRTGE